MSTILLVVFAVLTVIIMLGAGISKITGQAAMRQSAQHFSIPWPQYRAIGFLEVAAAVGIVIGFWVAALGLAAGIGVIALMLGAVVIHVRFRDPVTALIPALVALVVGGGYTVLQAMSIQA